MPDPEKGATPGAAGEGKPSDAGGGAAGKGAASVPEKFKGKTVDEVIKSYVELESMHGKTASELQQAKGIIESLRPYEKEIMALVTGQKPPEATPPTEGDPAKKPDEDEFFRDTGIPVPQATFAKAITPIIKAVVGEAIQQNLGPVIEQHNTDEMASLKAEFGEEKFLEIAGKVRPLLEKPLTKTELFRLAAMRSGINAKPKAPPREEPDDHAVATRGSANREPNEDEKKKASADFFSRLKNAKKSSKIFGS